MKADVEFLAKLKEIKQDIEWLINYCALIDESENHLSIEEKVEFILKNSTNLKTLGFINGVKIFMENGTLSKKQIESVDSTYEALNFELS